MRHQKRVAKLNRTASHRKALMHNLTAEVIRHGKIKTTLTKAKELRRHVEKLITQGKKGTLSARRNAYRILGNRSLVKALFDHIAPQYKERQGGYTRITKLGFRDNDSAEVALLELVDYQPPVSKKKKKSAKESAENKTKDKQKGKSTRKS